MNNISLRDYFAAMALQGLLARMGDGTAKMAFHDTEPAKLAGIAYQLADAMMSHGHPPQTGGGSRMVSGGRS